MTHKHPTNARADDMIPKMGASLSPIGLRLGTAIRAAMPIPERLAQINNQDATWSTKLMLGSSLYVVLVTVVVFG